MPSLLCSGLFQALAGARRGAGAALRFEWATFDVLHKADGFEAVRFGKDGGVKSRQQTTLDVDAFFANIDQMPMRQQEMNQK